MVIQAVQPKTLQLIKHASGSHVIHALLEQFPISLLGFLFDEVHKHCRELALDQQGLCVLKKCITIAPIEEFHKLAERVIYTFIIFELIVI